MQSTYSAPNKPLTPPNDHLKDGLSPLDSTTTLAPGGGEGITDFPSNEEAAPIPATTTTAGLHPDSLDIKTASKPSSDNPFVSKQEKIGSGADESLAQLLNTKNTDIPFGSNDIQGNSLSSGLNKSSINNDNSSLNNLLDRDDATPTPGTRTFTSSQRNETTYRIEREVLDILQWKDPVRSGAIFAATVGSILLTRWYSLLQISATGLTLATAINLIYVNFVVHSKKVLTNTEGSHPYRDIINNDQSSFIDRGSVKHYSNVIIDVLETLIRGLTRIVFVEDTLTSIKWMSIFFLVWKISAHVSSMNIILAFVISAFIFPHLYITNKDVVDAHLQRGQNIIQTNLNKAHQAAVDGIQQTYVKARASIAQVGTTGTDAKNTLNSASVTLKED